MEHCAIDLGSRKSQVCIRDDKGAIVLEKEHSTNRLASLFERRPPSRVILETSAEAFRVADQAIAAGHQVRVVPATLVKTLGVGARGIKNDRRDAQVLSEVSTRIELPSVHISSETSRQLKSICGSRDILTETRTKLINNVRGWLRTQLWRIRSGGAPTFAKRVRTHAAGQGQQLPMHIDRLLGVIETVTEQIRKADRQIRELASDDEVCRRLMTVPGVGAVVALRFRAVVDDHARFDSAHSIEAYLGLTPGEHSSAERRRRTGITKAGSRHARWLLVQAAWSAIRHRANDPMVLWAMRIAHRRGRHVAAVALARKLAGILYAIWRDGSSYRPSMSAES